MVNNVIARQYSGKMMSNTRILSIFFVSFSLFVVAEVIGALVSNSLSLLGDAAAMSIDVFTYVCNLYAEYIKSKMGHIPKRVQLILEVGIPTFSLTALIGVTTYVTWSAVLVVQNPDDKDNVNVFFLYGFASANFIVDVICTVVMTVGGTNALYETCLDSNHNEDKNYENLSMNGTDEKQDDLIPRNEDSRVLNSAVTNNRKTNLNMISAFTHVGGDTLRTVSVFIAALVSTIGGFSGEICDAWAAIVVAISILAVIIPLVFEISSAYNRIMQISENVTDHLPDSVDI